nr:hypothetical protein GCM10020241_24300 [Streptoalloteichus tenebrarius]
MGRVGPAPVVRAVVGLVEHPDPPARAPESEAGREAAQSRSDDDGVHTTTVVTLRRRRTGPIRSFVRW